MKEGRIVRKLELANNYVTACRGYFVVSQYSPESGSTIDRLRPGAMAYELAP